MTRKKRKRCITIERRKGKQRMGGKMEQLVNMGFSPELADEALNATGGADVFKAADWLLRRDLPNHPSSHSVPPPPLPTTCKAMNTSAPPLKNKEQLPSQLSPASNSPSPPPPPSDSQLKINRFFRLRTSDAVTADDHDGGAAAQQPPVKRQKLTQCSEPKGEEVVVVDDKPQVSAPLPQRMRPSTLDLVVGQDHLLGPNSLLMSAIRGGLLPSILLWGPPGSGKTSIARAIVSSCNNSSYRFVSISAVNAGVKDVREAVDKAKIWKSKSNKKTVLFIDEVHRFNKAQQDSFLPVIEDGSIVFIGATTENPSFHLITPLLSRCRVLLLKPLEPHHVSCLLKRAVSDTDVGLSSSIRGAVPVPGKPAVQVEEEAIEFLSAMSDGDARVALNVLEISATTAAARVLDNKGNDEAVIINVNLDDVKEALQSKHLAYDKDGDEHYNLISALHKSMRGSDANASIYWLARMLEGGEEPLYIARRLIRFASEDIGLADPSALTQAVACYQACHFIGMPECNVNLAQAVAYLALAPKSVSVYRAIVDAQKVVKDSVGQNPPVPLHLRNAPTKLMKDLGYGDGYIYPPDNPNSSQAYLPPALNGHKFLH